MILCLCLWRSLCRRLDFIPLFSCPYAYAYAILWTRLKAWFTRYHKHKHKGKTKGKFPAFWQHFCATSKHSNRICSSTFLTKLQKWRPLKVAPGATARSPSCYASDTVYTVPDEFGTLYVAQLKRKKTWIVQISYRIVQIPVRYYGCSGCVYFSVIFSMFCIE